MDCNIKDIIKENARRNKLLDMPYNPVSGIGCIGKRTRVDVSLLGLGSEVWIPDTMIADPQYRVAMSNADSWVKLRCRHDFEFWCVTCVKIKDKLSGCDIPFRLNAPQRRVAALFERQRIQGLPIRVIMLKARQWGGSTLTQMYMAWIQSVHCRNWHSLICAHVKDTAASIRGMYSKMLTCYPEQYWEGDELPKFSPFERSTNIREIAGRGCRVTVGSAENQEAVRGSDFAMAHLSETAFWSDSTTRSPERFIRAVCGAIALVPYSLIVMESTANGVGNYFHNEWLRAKDGNSDKMPVFVPWNEIEIYRMPVASPEILWRNMDGYDRELWNRGMTLEMINWYHHKRAEYSSHSMMKAEYPTDDVEAFTCTGHNVFSSESIERLRSGCRLPMCVGELAGDAITGVESLQNIRFVGDSQGKLQVWASPVVDASASRYIVAVDIGGRSAMSDYSVISVLDRGGAIPEVVAQWRGHVDHDILTWKSAQIARWYSNALLVIESNTLETGGAGECSLYTLSSLNGVYHNLYRRPKLAQFTDAPESRIGFHTNRATKSLIITNLVAMVRDGAYIERCNEVCNELATYEQLPNGSYAAKAGCHDDILMTRAIALYVASTTRVAPPQDFTAMLARPRW
ncbi:MAG: hypothetical protein E7081_02070 [Bacteroidales bacterium]|nr:hypothetical protein [Bacteroidales bacterium]